MPPGRTAGTEYVPLTPEEQAALDAMNAAAVTGAGGGGYQAAPPPPPQDVAPAAPPAEPYAPAYPASSDVSPSGRSAGEALGVSEAALPVATPSGQYEAAPMVAADPYAQEYAAAQLPYSYAATPPPDPAPGTSSAAASYGGVNQSSGVPYEQPTSLDRSAMQNERRIFGFQQAQQPPAAPYQPLRPTQVSDNGAITLPAPNMDIGNPADLFVQGANAKGMQENPERMRRRGVPERYAPAPPPSSNPLDVLAPFVQSAGQTVSDIVNTDPARNRAGVGNLIDNIITTPDEDPSGSRYVSPRSRIANPSRGVEEAAENVVGGVRDNNPQANRDAVGRLLGLDPNDPETDIANQISRNLYDFAGDQAGELLRDYGDNLGRLGRGAQILLTDPLLNVDDTGQLVKDPWQEAEDVFGPHGMGVRQAQSTANPAGSALQESILEPLGDAKDDLLRDPTQAWQSGPGVFFDNAYQQEAARIAQSNQSPPQNKFEAGAQTATDAGQFAAAHAGELPGADILNQELQRQRGAALARQLRGEPIVPTPYLALPPDVAGIAQTLTDAARQTAESSPRGRNAGQPYTPSFPSSSDEAPMVRPSRPAPESRPIPDIGEGIGGNVQQLPPRYDPLASAYPVREPGLVAQLGQWGQDRLTDAQEAIQELQMPSYEASPPGVPDITLPAVDVPNVTLPNISMPGLGGVAAGATPGVTQGNDPLATVFAAEAATNPATVGAQEAALPDGTSLVSEAGSNWIKDANGEYLGMVNPATGENILFPEGASNEDKQALIDGILAQVPATAPASTTPTEPAQSSTSTTTSAPVYEPSAPAYEAATPAYSESYDTNYSGGSDYGTRRSQRSYGDSDSDDSEPELSLEDFLRDYDDDGEIGTEDRRRAKREFAASRKRRGGSRRRSGQRVGFDPFNRPESLIRTQVLDALDLGLPGGVPVRRKKAS